MHWVPRNIPVAQVQYPGYSIIREPVQLFFSSYKYGVSLTVFMLAYTCYLDAMATMSMCELCIILVTGTLLDLETTLLYVIFFVVRKYFIWHT